jgi:hypothetical protein
MARQPWQVMRLLLPVLMSALIPTRLTELVLRLGAVTDRLVQTDGRRNQLKQVDRYRSGYEPATWNRLALRC